MHLARWREYEDKLVMTDFWFRTFRSTDKGKDRHDLKKWRNAEGYQCVDSIPVEREMNACE